MPFLSDTEKNSLYIDKMILHVVGNGEFTAEPEFPQPSEEEFFLTRIRDNLLDGVHRFRSDSETRLTMESIISGRVVFEEGCQSLSKRFSEIHVKSARDGAFFIFWLKSQTPGIDYFALVKYDYIKAIELYERDGKSALRQIVQALVQEPRAIQKYCFVKFPLSDASGDICARDRMAPAPDLTDYFARFLGVERDRSPRELNEAALRVLQSSIEECAPHLNGRERARALSAAKTNLTGRNVVGNQAIQEAVYHGIGQPDHISFEGQIEPIVTKHLRRNRISGVEFQPDRTVLRTVPKRIMETREGVKIVFPGELEDDKVKQQTTDDGRTIITILSDSRLLSDATLPSRSR